MIDRINSIKKGELWNIDRSEKRKFLLSQYLFNPQKLDRIDGNKLNSLPQDILDQTNSDDHYLVQAYYAKGNCIIITTDEPLKEALFRNGVDCQHRNTFVPQYIVTQQKIK